MVEFVGRGGQSRHDLAGGEVEDVGDRLRVPGRHFGDGVRGPSGVLHRLDQGPGPFLRLVGGDAGRGGLVEPQRLAQARQGGGAAPDLAGPQDREDEVDPVGAGRGAAQHMQAVTDLGVLDLAEPAVEMHDELVEALVLGAVLQPQVVVELGGLDQGPDLCADRRELRRVHRRDLGVLVQELFEAGDVPVAVGTCHRRYEVVHQGGVDAPLGLCPLARVVDQERVDQREVAQGGIGAAGGGEAGVLAGQPLQVAVLAEVDHRVGAEAVVVGGSGDPAVGGQVVVRGRQIGVVVDRDRVLAEAARRLDEDEQIAAAQGGEHDVAVRVARPVHEHLARGGAPVLLDGLAELGREGRVPAPVVGGGDPDRVAGQLLLGEPLLVVAAGLDQCADQLVAVARDQAGDLLRTEVVSLVAESAQQGHGAGRGVEADGVADPGVLGRVRGQHQRDPLLGGRDVAQPGVAHRDPGDAGGALGVGDVRRQAVLVDLLEGERHGDQAAVELGYRDLAGGVERGDALVVVLPVGARSGEAERLEDGDVEVAEDARVPGLVVAARRCLGRPGAARGEDGSDDRVGGAQRVDQLGLGGAQRGDVQRQRAGTGVLDGAAQGVHERGVAAHVVGAVVEHGDDRAVGTAGGALQRAPGGCRGGRCEAVAGEQDGVGEEAGELVQVGGTAVGQVGVGLGGDADGDRGGGHQLGVGGLFAGEDDDGASGGEDLVEAVLPGAYATEEAYDDQVDAVEELREVLEREPGGVGVAVGDRAVRGAGTEQVGVGRRQEQDHAASGLPRGVHAPGGVGMESPLLDGVERRGRSS